MDGTLSLLLSSLLALLTLGAGAPLPAVTVKNKVKIQLECTVHRIQALEDTRIGGKLDPSIEKHLEGLSSVVEVVKAYKVLLQTLPLEGLSQLREDVSTLMAWLEKMCPGGLTGKTALAESQLETLKRFEESKAHVVLREMERFLSHLKNNLSCSTRELRELEKKSASLTQGATSHDSGHLPVNTE